MRLARIAVFLVMFGLTGWWAYALYPLEDPPAVNPGVHEFGIDVKNVTAPNAGGMSVEVRVTPGTATAGHLATMEAKGATGIRAWDVYQKGTVGVGLAGGGIGAPFGAGYLAVASPGKTYAAVQIPPMTIVDKDWDGVGSNPVAGSRVEFHVRFVGWSAYTWTGGPAPSSAFSLPATPGESLPDGDPLSKQYSPDDTEMWWTLYADANGHTAPIQLSGTNLSLQRKATNALFLSGVLAGMAGAALLAIVPELLARRQSRKGHEASGPALTE